MEMNNLVKSFAIGLILAGMTFSVAAQNPAGTSADGGNQTADTSNPSNVSIEAGSTVDLDVNQESLTDKWAGFFGNISASKVLGTTSGLMYEWAASTIPDNSEVIVTPQGDPTPSSVNAVNDPNSLLGSEFDSGVANASGTFSQDDSVDVLGQDGVSTAAVDTYNSTGAVDDTFTTYLLENGAQSDSPVYVAEANPQSEGTGFTGDAVNYQLLVGVGENPTEESFTFYLELP
jgi:hypothetical protein